MCFFVAERRLLASSDSLYPPFLSLYTTCLSAVCGEISLLNLLRVTSCGVYASHRPEV